MLDAHLAGCAACRGLAADLAEVRAAAGRLADRPVPDAVWARLRPMLPAPVAAGPGLERPLAGRRRGAAAGGGRRAGHACSAPRLAAATRGDAAVAQVAADLEAAEAHYLRAIAGLERIARMDDPALDPEVARVLRANLQEIDGAIRDTRAALAARPEDDVARRGLFEALGGKVALLEQTVSIIDADRALDEPPPVGDARN